MNLSHKTMAMLAYIFKDNQIVINKINKFPLSNLKRAVISNL